MLPTRILIIALTIVTVACAKQTAPAAERPCARIVSLAPSATETLFELGLGPRIVGVTRYCTWPPEAARIPRIGGWHDPSLEAVLAARPDTVFHLPEQNDIAGKLRAAGIATVALPAQGLDDVPAAARLIGDACGAEKEAKAFAGCFGAALRQVEARSAGKERPRVLVVVGRASEERRVSGLFVAGKGSFHDELIAKAGGQNACAVAVPYPRISAEGLFAMNPDIIIEFISDDEAKNASPADWKDFDTVGAVKNGRIHIVTGDRSFIPGPRAPLLLEELARLIHPENGATP